MSLFTLLLGGDLWPTRALRATVAGSRVIAADSGIRHADALGATPELWVGDFDSAQQEARARHAGIPIEAYPQDKDRTDGEIAIEAALVRGATSLLLAGAFGGPRADHAFLHLAAALRCAEAGVGAVLTDGRQEGRPLLPGAAGFDYPDGALFSILAFDDLAGLSIEGAKWPLADVAVPFGSSLTLSNAVQGRLRVTLGSGRAMLIAQTNPSGTD